MVVDVETGSVVRRMDGGAALGRARAIAFSPDGASLVAVSAEGNLIGVGVESEADDWSIDGHVVPVTAAHWIESGVVAGDGSGRVTVWSPPVVGVRSSIRTESDLWGHRYAIVGNREVVFRGDGLSTGIAIKTESPADHVLFDIHGRYTGVIEDSLKATIVDTETQTLKTISLPGACNIVFDLEDSFALVLSEDSSGQILSLGSKFSSDVSLPYLSDPCVPLQELRLVLTGKGRVVARLDESRKTLLHDVNSGVMQIASELEAFHSWSGDRGGNVTIVDGASVWVWSLDVGEFVMLQELPFDRKYMNIGAYLPLGRGDELFGFYDMENLSYVELDYPVPAAEFHWESDGKRLAVWGDERFIVLGTSDDIIFLDVEMSEISRNGYAIWPRSEKNPSVAFATETGALLIWDFESGSLQQRLDVADGPIVAFKMFDDNKRVVTLNADGYDFGRARVWSLADESVLFEMAGVRLLQAARQFQAPIAFDVKNNILETVGKRGVRHWDIAPETRTPQEVRGVIERSGPWVLREGRLVRP